MRRNGVRLAGLMLAAAAAAACTSATANAPLKGTPAANALVCRHYLAQRNWVKHLTRPTAADAEQFINDVSVDESQATGKLFHDLFAMVRNSTTEGNAYYEASVRVYRDCT